MTLSLSYDATLARVVITGTGLPDGAVRVEHSLNGVLWETVRGGAVVPVDGGGFELSVYEFAPGVVNHYRLVPAVAEVIAAASDDQTNGADWTVPNGVSELTVECWGGGGWGQGSVPPAANTARPGGGGGAYARSTLTVLGGETLRVRVGEGGRAGGANASGTGVSSLVARGDSLLVEAVGGGGSAGLSAAGAGGDAALCIGDVRFSGGAGGARESVTGAGGGGGGSAWPTGNGIPGAPGALGIGGAGGDGAGDGGTGGAQPPGLRLSGAAGSYLSTPDAAALDITGDLDLRAIISLDDWTPSTQLGLVAKWVLTGNQRSWLFSLLTDGTLRLTRSSDGTASASETSTAPVPATAGPLGVRVTLDADNGSAGHTVRFYTSASADLAGPWTELGTAVTVAGTVTMFNSTAVVEVGSWGAGASGNLPGIVHAAQIRSGIDGTVVAQPQPHQQATDTTSWADSAGRTWTVTGAGARIINASGSGMVGVAPGGGGGGQGSQQLYNPTVPVGGAGAAGRVTLHSWPGYPFTGGGLDVPAAGSYASTPDHASLDIVGDLDIAADVALADWATGAMQNLVAKYATNSNQRAYALRIDGAGMVSLLWSVNGTSSTNKVSTVPVPMVDGGRITLRATLDVDNGAAGHTVRFYTGPSIAGPWTQLGDPVTTAGVTSVFASTAALVVGARLDPAGDAAPGRYYAARVRAGIAGTIVADPDFAAQPPGTTSFADSAGRTWTLAGAAAIPAPPAMTGSITPVIDQVWLKSIRYPMLNRGVGRPAWDPITRPTRGSALAVAGRSLPIGVVDLKGSRRWQLTLVTRTLEEARDLDLVLAANQVLYIQTPPEADGCGPVAAVPGGYVLVGDTVQTRPIPGRAGQLWTIPVIEVAKPAPEVVPTTLTWGTVLRLYGSWQALIASNPTWRDLYALVGSPEDLVVLL